MPDILARLPPAALVTFVYGTLVRLWAPWLSGLLLVSDSAEIEEPGQWT